MLAIPECDQFIAADEEINGPAGVWNSVFRLQEIVYRAGTARMILWLMAAINDWILTGKLQISDISVARLKSGTGSLSDIAMMQLDLRDYLLGQWMDNMNFPPYMKEKCRELFDSRKSYREHYMPLEGIVDTTWLFKWPEWGKQVLNFLESVLYNPTGHEEFMMRQAVKNSNSPAEIMSWKPWCKMLPDLRDAQARSTEPAPSTTGDCDGSVAELPQEVVDSDAEEEHEFTKGIQLTIPGTDRQVPKEVLQAAGRLNSQLFSLLVEPATQANLTERLKTCSLANIEPNVGTTLLVLVDCNVFGEADSQPRHRATSMKQDIFTKWLRSIRSARGGSDDTPLRKDDLFLCFNATKDRKRIFSKPLQCPDKSKKDPERTVTCNIMLHFDDMSWRARRGRHSDRSNLTQMCLHHRHCCHAQEHPEG